MKKNIHPKYRKITATCTCGHVINTSSTVGKNLSLDVCNKCHPFFTGNQRIIHPGGRIENFRKRFRILDQK